MKKLLGVLILGLLWCNISFADDKRLEEKRKKIFEKKQSDENIGGLAYLLNTNK